MLLLQSAKRARLPLGTLALLLALFGWGLQYKTSLYHSGKDLHSHSVPPAKLLSEAERRISARHSVDSAVSAASVKTTAGHAEFADGDLSAENAAYNFALVSEHTPERQRPFWRLGPRSPPRSQVTLSANKT